MNTLRQCRMRAAVAALAGGLVAPLLFAATAGAAPPDREDAVVAFSRDVYVVVNGQLRHPNSQTLPDARLFNISGADMGLTWGQFASASAVAKAKSVGGAASPRTDAALEFSGLVPNGVYSVFYLTFGPDSLNPLCPNVERALPLTATHPERQFPDASSFVADATGGAPFRARVDGALLEATELQYLLIYHLDGHTYGSLPNRGEFVTQGDECRSSFGEDAMRQLIVHQK